jgi:hypothetical protein
MVGMCLLLIVSNAVFCEGTFLEARTDALAIRLAKAESDGTMRHRDITRSNCGAASTSNREDNKLKSVPCRLSWLVMKSVAAAASMIK